MRFTVCSISAIALLLGSASEPVQAASLITQHDSQGAFDELLQLDVGTDVDVDGDANANAKAKADADAEMFENEAEILALAVQEFRDLLDELDDKYTNWKYTSNYKGEEYSYCQNKQKLDNESTLVEKDINEQMHKMQKSLDDYYSDLYKIPHLYSLSTKQQLAEQLGVKGRDPSEDEILAGIVESRKMLAKRIEADFSTENVRSIETLDYNKRDDDPQNGDRQAKVAEMTKALNYWGGRYDLGRNKAGFFGDNDNRRYVGSMTFAKHLIKASCNNSGSEAATTAQQVGNVALTVVNQLAPLVGDLMKISTQATLSGPTSQVSVTTG